MTDSTITEIPGRMSAELREALERAKGYKMSPEEIFEQKVSFVYGQQDHDNPNPRSKDEIRQMLIESQGRPACEECPKAKAAIQTLVEALEEARFSVAADVEEASNLDSHAFPFLQHFEARLAKIDNALASVKQPGGR